MMKRPWHPCNDGVGTRRWIVVHQQHPRHYLRDKRGRVRRFEFYETASAAALKANDAGVI